MTTIDRLVRRACTIAPGIDAEACRVIAERAAHEPDPARAAALFGSAAAALLDGPGRGCPHVTELLARAYTE